MESYNRLISHALHRNIYDYLDNQPQPDALSSGVLYGGKRVRAHPQAGNTAYNHEPATLIPQHSLMQHKFIENLEGGKKYNVDKFISDFKKIGQVLKPVAKPILTAMTDKAVEKIKASGRPRKALHGGASELYPPSVAKGGARKSTKKTTKKTTKSVSNKKSERGQLISKIMKEKGLNLGQASKYIKEHNLM